MAVSCDRPRYTAIFNYNIWISFSATFETGLDSIPRFDVYLTSSKGSKGFHIQYTKLYISSIQNDWPFLKFRAPDGQ